MTAARPDFAVAIDQNKYLHDGATELNAVVTVDAAPPSSGPVGPTGPPNAEAAEVIMVDTSGSMDYPPQKIRAARTATAAAVDALRDGTLFAVIAGTARARVVYPPSGRLVEASSGTKAAAKQAVSQLTANGGTAMGKWLSLANDLFAQAPHAIHHAILLTDGKNEHEKPEELDQVLNACEGRFVCDARGIGDGWEPDELLKIVSRLLGEADAVGDPAELEGVFRGLMANAMGKSLSDVALRVMTTQCARVRFVKQVFPTENDLTASGVPVRDRLTDFSLGPWGPDESRDYHVCLELDPTGMSKGEDVMAAKLSLVLRGGGSEDVLTGRHWLLRAHWTDDVRLSTQINPKVAHYTGQAELGEAVRSGLEALDAQDFDTATARLGEAVRRASEMGNERTARLLAEVVDVVDAPTGTVRLKPGADREKVKTAKLVSVKTVRMAKE